MEVGADMLQEESRVAGYRLSPRHAQDRTIRRLQWTVACCVIGLCALLGLTAYQMFGAGGSDRKDKVYSEPYRHADVDRNAAAKPSAHLTGTRQSDFNTQELQWEVHHGLAFIRDGMQYVNKSIQIPKEGYYFVYSQVSFRLWDHGCNKRKYVSQTIIRFNFNYPEPENLLSGKSLCGKENVGFQPIYLGALLHLKKGDQLKVNVNAIELVDISVDYKTFFGAFLI